MCEDQYANHLPQDAIKATKLPRSSLYITSKVWHPKHTRSGAYDAVLESLSALQTPYIDLYLLHNPSSGPEGRHQAWLGLQRAVSEGKVKTIGVSNFTPSHITQLLQASGVTIPPAINQIEMHPWNQQKEIVAYCRKEGIAVQAYTPIAKGSRLQDEVIQKVAGKYGKSGAQVVLRWMVEQDVVVIPKSENPGRIRENAGLWDFGLDEEDRRAIAGLDRGMEGNVGMWDPFAHE